MPVDPVGIDTSKPSIARVYDYLLRGPSPNNYRVDRESAEDFLAQFPSVRGNALANRAFMGRAVRHLAAQGVDQYIDIGSGLPTARNVHQVAQEINPDARVVYVDNDPVVLAEGRGLLAGNGGTVYIDADGRDTEKILTHPDTVRLIDFSRPVGLLLISVAHYFPGDPAQVIARYAEHMAPGSFLVLAHIASDGVSEALRERMSQVFGGGEYMRPKADILRMFQHWPLEPPGLVDVQHWPEPVGEPSEQPLLGGVARKP